MHYGELYRFCDNTKGLGVHKFPHYFEIYERHLNWFRSQPQVFLAEVGVAAGGSLEMWRAYMREDARIAGIDKVDMGHLNIEGVELFQGDQADASFWKGFFKENGPVDIFIDDGSHISTDQIVTIKAVLPNIKDGGIYICEDCQTSYHSTYGGGYRKPGTLIEHAKDIIDEINAWASEDPEGEYKKTENTRKTYSIHFYPYMVVIERRNMDRELISPIMRGGPHAKNQ